MVTKYQNVYIPEAMLADCEKTAWRPGGSFRALAGLAEARGNDVDNCNAKLRAVRDYQSDLKGQESGQK